MMLTRDLPANASSLFCSERLDGIDLRCTPCWQVTRERGGREDDDDRGDVSDGVKGLDTEQERRHRTSQRRGRDEAYDDAYSAQREAVPQEHPRELARLGAERQANADLPSSLRNDVSDDAVDPDDAERQRHAARDREHHEHE